MCRNFTRVAEIEVQSAMAENRPRCCQRPALDGVCFECHRSLDKQATHYALMSIHSSEMFLLKAVLIKERKERFFRHFNKQNWLAG